MIQKLKQINQAELHKLKQINQAEHERKNPTEVYMKYIIYQTS